MLSLIKIKNLKNYLHFIRTEKLEIEIEKKKKDINKLINDKVKLQQDRELKKVYFIYYFFSIFIKTKC